MGAHSNFEQALAGVTAFATAVASDSESEDRRRWGSLTIVDCLTYSAAIDQKTLLALQVQEGKEAQVQAGQEGDQEVCQAQVRRQKEAEETQVQGHLHFMQSSSHSSAVRTLCKKV